MIVMDVSVLDTVVVVALLLLLSVVVYMGCVRCLRNRRPALERVCSMMPASGLQLPLVGWKTHRANLIDNQTMVLWNDDKEEATGQAGADAGNAPRVVLPVLQVPVYSIEFEDPQHPLTAVTSSGRRHSSVDNTNVVRPQPLLANGRRNADSENENDDERKMGAIQE